MASWIINFTSPLGNRYRVEIDGASSETELIPAPNTFVVQEDTDRNPFKPVRLVTGYVRFYVNSEAEWKAIIPTSAVDRPVRFYQVGASYTMQIWAGYLKPEVYTVRLFDFPQMVELPIVCPFSTISRNDMSLNDQPKVKSIAWLLYKCLTGGEDPETTSETPWFSSIYFQGAIATAKYWLDCKVCLSTLYFTDSDEVLKPKYDYLTLLEHICTFFGWTCRTYNRGVYFLCANDALINSGAAMMGAAAFKTYAAGTNTTMFRVTPTVYQLDNLQLYADSTTEMLNGKHNARVTSKVERVTSVIELPWDYIANAFSIYGVEKDLIFGSGDDGLWFFHRVGLIREGGRIGDVYIRQYQHAPLVPQQYYSGNINNLRNYSLENVMEISSLTTEETPFINISTVGSFHYENGILVLSGVTKGTSFDGDNLTWTPANGWIYVRVTVGDKVWNGSSWVNKDNFTSYVKVQTGVRDTSVQTGVGAIVNTRSLDDPYPSYEGYGMVVSDGLTGPVSIEILKFEAIGTGYDVWILDFKLEFLRSNATSVRRDVDENVYTAGNSRFAEVVEVENVFASDNANSAGSNIILDPSGKNLITLPYDGQTGRPEQRMADRIGVDYGSKTHEVLSLKTRDSWLSPMHVISHGGKSFEVASVSRNYSEDQSDYIAVEI